MAEFHIHIDAKTVSPEFEKYLVHDLKFWRSDFVDSPDDKETYTPTHHLTQKMQSAVEFREMFDQVIDFLHANTGSMDGYIEGEFVPLDEDLELTPYDDSVPLPFSVTSEFLPDGEFRETEVHVTVSEEESDPRLLEAMEQMGFMVAYLPKTYGMARVFTVQGSLANIGSLIPVLLKYLKAVGGAARCSIKEERVARHWMSRPDIPRPPVVKTVTWKTI